MIRKPIVAGQFYPEKKEELLAEINRCFLHKFGPGKLPEPRGKKKIYGAIVPHAGYFFSGAGAAWVYKGIGETQFPDLYIILGVNHSGPYTCSSDEEWETPLGNVKCDKELITLLEKKGIQIHNEMHHHEHSIEVQLPFLQFISRDRITDLKIVPIMIADQRFEHWGRIIKEALKETKKKAVIICSSDFTHYGENYGYIPFEKDVKENLKKLDGTAINFITKPNPKGFLQYTEKTMATICGRYGISALLWLIKYLDKERKGKLLKYYTSGDILEDYNNAVGYAAIVFR